MPAIKKLANKCRLTPDQKAEALVLGWYRWRQSRKILPASVWARSAVRQARAGRNLPGCTTHRKDALGRGRPFQGSGMGQVADRADGPAKLAEDAEVWEAFLSSLDARYLRIVRLILKGLSNQEVAECMGVTPGAISQARRVLWLRYAECE